MKTKSGKEIIRKKKYIAKGVVYGLSWDNYKVNYDSKTYESDNIKDLYKKLKDDFNDKSIDCGFGFQDILQADIEIGKVTTFVIGKGKDKREFDHIVSKVINIYRDENNEIQIYDMTEWERN